MPSALSSTTILTSLLTTLSQLQTNSVDAPPSIARALSPADQQTADANFLKHTSNDEAERARSVFMTLHFLFPNELLPALDLIDRGLVGKFLYRPTLSQTKTVDADDPESEKNHNQWREIEVSGRATRNLPENREDKRERKEEIADSEGEDDEHPIDQSPPLLRPPQQPVLSYSNSKPRQRTLYYVQSASSQADSHLSKRGGRFRDAYRRKATGRHYEVRLDSWNCGCAAFAYSALTLLTDESLTLEIEEGEKPAVSEGEAHRRREDGGNRARSQEDEVGSFAFGGLATTEKGVIPICKHILAAAIWEHTPGVKRDELDGGRIGRRIGREDIAAWGGGWEGG